MIASVLPREAESPAHDAAGPAGVAEAVSSRSSRPPSRRRALIVEAGGTRGALAATRALGKAGWTVGVATPSGTGMAASSRFASARHEVPSASDDGDGFLGALAAAIDEHGYEVVLSGGDAELAVISAGRERLRAAVPHPPHPSVIRALDKVALTAAARGVGWQVPPTEPATAGRAPSWEGPTVVKARLHSPGEGTGGPARLEAALAERSEEAVALAERMRAAGGEPFFQARKEGRLAAFVAVCAEGGTIVASAAQVAEATSPPSLGVSVRARSVPIDARLQAEAAALLAELGWFGIAEIQYILDGQGRRWLIDLNPRLYGSLQLAVAAGANLPVAWAAVATGRPLPDDLRGEPGVGLNWAGGGLGRALRGPRSQAPREVAEALRPRRGWVGPIWEAGDPRPGLVEMRRLIHRAARLGGADGRT